MYRRQMRIWSEIGLEAIATELRPPRVRMNTLLRAHL